jgi:hypothetical protein
MMGGGFRLCFIDKIYRLKGKKKNGGFCPPFVLSWFSIAFQGIPFCTVFLAVGQMPSTAQKSR